MKNTFDGLFTQYGLSWTYKDPDIIVSPDEIINVNGKKYLKSDNSKLITVGPWNQCLNQKKTQLIRKYHFKLRC